MERTGDLCEIQRTFEWKFKDFLLLKDKSGKGYKSPPFSFLGVFWEIWLYPYGEKRNETVGWISIFLVPTSKPKPVTISYSFSFKTEDEDSDSEWTDSRLFDKTGFGTGRSKMILRSTLIERESELLPSGTLTVICTLKSSEPDDVIENTFLDAAIQTDRQSEFLNSYAQTEEGAGIWKLQQNLREISLNGDISDVTLKVEDQEFKAHRCILATRSPVFSAMMKNKMKENVTGVVHIEDVDSKTFSDFLHYLYTGSAENLTSENVAELYIAADKYQVEMLKENCLDYMLTNVSVDNFCDIFMLSVQHNEEKLKETCIHYFGEHLLDIIKSCKWQSFLCENPIISNELHIKHIERSE